MNQGGVISNRHNTRSVDFKDYEFSRAPVTDLWDVGHNDVRRSIANPDWHRVTDPAEGIRVCDLSRQHDPEGTAGMPEDDVRNTASRCR